MVQFSNGAILSLKHANKKTPTKANTRLSFFIFKESANNKIFQAVNHD